MFHKIYTAKVFLALGSGFKDDGIWTKPSSHFIPKASKQIL